MSILILREEIVCLGVILFILFCTLAYKMKDADNSFTKLLLMGLGHVVFDAITVVTVNNRDVVPDPVNKILHLIFYVFSILFVAEFYDYIIKIAVPHNKQKVLRAVRYIPVIIYVFLFFILPIEYVEGNGTNYSYGPLVFVGYGLFVIYCMTCFIIVLCYRSRLERKIQYTLLPMFIVMIIIVLTQAFVPELLMTGAGITFICIGLFAAVNNPTQQYMEQAFWDGATGIKNKNAYRKQLEIIEKKYKNKSTRIGFIVADMNGLKVINDNYGHAEGDKLIRITAGILNSHLKSSHDIYRVGGDEFVAIYFQPDDSVVEKEIEAVMKACEAYVDSPVTLSVALGYASGIYSPEYINIYNSADSKMYERKIEIKKKHPELCGR